MDDAVKSNQSVQALVDGQLLLMDAGCERHGYASDVTRCWPVNGRFSPEQAAVYHIVQEVHRQAPLHVGLPTSQLHAFCCELVVTHWMFWLIPKLERSYSPPRGCISSILLCACDCMSLTQYAQGNV